MLIQISKNRRIENVTDNGGCLRITIFNKKKDNEIQETWDEFNADYMGGHKLHPKKKFTEVYIFEDRVVIKEIGISIPFSAIKNVENMDEQRITKTRVFLTGFIVGLLWKKKFLYTVIDYNDGLMDQTIILDFGRGIEEAQHMIYEGMIRARNSSTSKSVSIPRSGAPIAFGQPAKQVSNSEGIDNSKNRETEEDPFHILKVRLAKGEISKEEYDEIRKAME